MLPFRSPIEKKKKKNLEFRRAGIANGGNFVVERLRIVDYREITILHFHGFVVVVVSAKPNPIKENRKWNKKKKKSEHRENEMRVKRRSFGFMPGNGIMEKEKLGKGTATALCVDNAAAAAASKPVITHFRPNLLIER